MSLEIHPRTRRRHGGGHRYGCGARHRGAAGARSAPSGGGPGRGDRGLVRAAWASGPQFSAKWVSPSLPL